MPDQLVLDLGVRHQPPTTTSPRRHEGGSVIRPVHPFPARMAPEIALAELQGLPEAALVLDPMAGSGTVLRHAVDLGHRALGFDLDPLAVLMARVWTTPVDDLAVEKALRLVLEAASEEPRRERALPWMDTDTETSAFVDYWFGPVQRGDLRRLAAAIMELEGADPAVWDLLGLALSRIIVTKDKGASLARDVSHSRPHKVADASAFEVLPAFERSVRTLRSLLGAAPPPGNAKVCLGDARSVGAISDGSIDMVLTSPPYLNAIDYMRGHRMSLVWLGHRLADLRRIRSDSIGAERALDPSDLVGDFVADVHVSMVGDGCLTPRHQGMVRRYARDAVSLAGEVARVLRPGGLATLVVGNSCLKGTFIRNSDGVQRAAELAGLTLVKAHERDLPPQSRYLPMPKDDERPLGRRIRTESVLTFRAA